jgi:hypothetical protein
MGRKHGPFREGASFEQRLLLDQEDTSMCELRAHRDVDQRLR